MLRGRPGGFRFNVDPVARMFETHSRMVFRSGTGARRPSLKVPTECSLCRGLRFIVLEKRLDNETTMLARPTHGII